MSTESARQFAERMDDGDLDDQILVESGPDPLYVFVVGDDTDDDPTFDPYDIPPYTDD